VDLHAGWGLAAGLPRRWALGSAVAAAGRSNAKTFSYLNPLPGPVDFCDDEPMSPAERHGCSWREQRADMSAGKSHKKWSPAFREAMGGANLSPSSARSVFRPLGEKPSTDLRETGGAEPRSGEHRRVGA